MVQKALFILISIILLCNSIYADEKKDLFSAVKSNDLELAIQLIKDGADVNGIDETGQSPLHHACYLGYLEIIKLLLDNGANVNKTVPKLALTPIHGATMNGNRSIVALLVDRGADINARDSEGATPIFAACWIGAIDTVKYLISKGARFDVKTNYGTTPFHNACQSNNLELVDFLIKNGSSVNNQAQNGATPLHMAVARGEIPIVELLIKNGAKAKYKMKWDSELSFNLKAPILKDEDIMVIKFLRGQTALDVAIKSGNEQLIKIINNSIL